MKNGDLIRALSMYPEDWDVMVEFEPIEKVEVGEGTTSDGPGWVLIRTVEQ